MKSFSHKLPKNLAVHEKKPGPLVIHAKCVFWDNLDSTDA